MSTRLWFALKLVSLHYQTQPRIAGLTALSVVICFKISIFALSDTTQDVFFDSLQELWFALKLVSLHYQTQRINKPTYREFVVICFKISIFALSDTTIIAIAGIAHGLWFALKLVSLHYQTQLWVTWRSRESVVICFKISIFALSDTTIWILYQTMRCCDLL